MRYLHNQAIKQLASKAVVKIDDAERLRYIADREREVEVLFERMGDFSKAKCKTCAGKGHYSVIRPGMAEGEVMICACLMKNPKGRDLLRELHKIVQPDKEQEEGDEIPQEASSD